MEACVLCTLSYTERFLLEKNASSYFSIAKSPNLEKKNNQEMYA